VDVKFIFVRSGAKAIIFILVMALLAPVWSLGAQTPEQLIAIEQKIEPLEILVKGAVGEEPQTATVTLTLAGPQASVPVDLVLVLDRSKSVNLKTVKKIAKELIKHLSDQDRIGLVSFADSAVLDMGLNPDRKAIERTIDGLLSGRETALGEALAQAVDELLTKGRAEALKIIVLLTDGLRTMGREPLAPAQRAAENNIKIFPIGISHHAKRSLLSQIAEVTGGTFFDAFSDQVLEKMFKKIGRAVVARYINIIETLSPAINFEGGVENPPKGVHKTKRGTTILEWSHSILFVGEVWAAAFQISASSPGTLTINQEPSKVSFIGPKGKRLTQSIPISELAVKLATTPTTSTTQGSSQSQEPSEDLKQKIEELEKRLTELEEKLSAQAQTLEELGQKVAALDLEALRQELENLKTQLGTLPEIPGRLDALEQRLNELAQKVETPETETLRQDVENIKTQLSSLSNLPQLVDELKSKLEKLENELAQRPAVPESLQQDVESLKTQLGSLSSRMNELQSSLNAAIQELKDRLAALEGKPEQPPPTPTGALSAGTIAAVVILVFLVVAGFAAYEWLRRRPKPIAPAITIVKKAPPKAPARPPKK